MDKKIYAVIGEHGFTCCEEYLQPSNTIEMNGVNPDPVHSVAMPDGTWGPSNDYATNRSIEIHKTWPVNAQLEALVEALEYPPRPYKLNALREFMQTLRLQYPKE